MSETDALILSRYRPLSDAGRGGYAQVIRAWDTRIKRSVAIKRMPLSTDSEGNVAGLAEAQTAALLSHPHIVGVLDFDIEDDNAYLIMEYIDGLTLRDVLTQASEHIDADVVATVFESVASALTFAHENQVLHLDIKPENILIDHEGQVKVTDFGMAQLSHAQGFSAAKGGTIGYMPPEQMRREALDERSDEWAFAACIYEMISGENPFVARDLDKAIRAIEGAEIVLPSLCMDGIAEEFDDVLCTALDPRVAERYERVSDFEQAASGLLGDARRGKRTLKHLVSVLCDEDAAQDDAGASIADAAFGAATGIVSWSNEIIGRIPWRGVLRLVASGCAAASAGALALGLPGVHSVADVMVWVCVGIAAVAAFWSARAGVSALSILWCVILGASSGFSAALVVSVLLLVISLFAWRSSPHRGLVALLAPVACAGGCMAALPLLAGLSAYASDFVRMTPRTDDGQGVGALGVADVASVRADAKRAARADAGRMRRGERGQDLDDDASTMRGRGRRGGRLPWRARVKRVRSGWLVPSFLYSAEVLAAMTGADERPARGRWDRLSAASRTDRLHAKRAGGVQGAAYAAHADNTERALGYGDIRLARRFGWFVWDVLEAFLMSVLIVSVCSGAGMADVSALVSGSYNLWGSFGVAAGIAGAAENVAQIFAGVQVWLVLGLWFVAAGLARLSFQGRFRLMCPVGILAGAAVLGFGMWGIDALASVLPQFGAWMSVVSVGVGRGVAPVLLTPQSTWMLIVSTFVVLIIAHIAWVYTFAFEDVSLDA